MGSEGDARSNPRSNSCLTPSSEVEHHSVGEGEGNEERVMRGLHDPCIRLVHNAWVRRATRGLTLGATNV